MDNMGKLESGRLLIEMIQQKTKELILIPLLKPAADIFNKYNNEERKITGKVLPRISNQKLNAYLKIIAELTGISKKLTSHIARHTCATTILLLNGAPLKGTSVWLGYNNQRQTEDYAKVPVSYLEEIA